MPKTECQTSWKVADMGAFGKLAMSAAEALFSKKNMHDRCWDQMHHLFSRLSVTSVFIVACLSFLGPQEGKANQTQCSGDGLRNCMATVLDYRRPDGWLPKDDLAAERLALATFSNSIAECESGSLVSCQIATENFKTLASAISDETVIASLKRRLTQHTETHCKAGSAVACIYRSTLALEDPEDFAEKFENQEALKWSTIARDTSESGQRELAGSCINQDDSACITIWRYRKISPGTLTPGLAVEDHFPVEAYLTACEQSIPGACFDLKSFLFSALDSALSSLAFESLAKGCSGGSANLCHVASTLGSRLASKVERDQFRERACNLRHPDACFTLATFAMAKERNDSGDLTSLSSAARSRLQTSCKSRNLYACEILNHY